MPSSDDEFAEFETDEATFDAMLAAAEPAQIVSGPVYEVTIRQVDNSSFHLVMPASPFVSVSAPVSVVPARDVRQQVPRRPAGRVVTHRALDRDGTLAS